MQIMRAALLTLLLSSVVGSRLVRAQDAERITLFKTASDDEASAELAAAIDPIVRSALGENPYLVIASEAAVDLPSLQLAIDCVGETVDCLRAAANQSEAARLFAPSVRRTDSGLLVTFLYFDSENVPPIRTVERRYTGEGQGQAALTGVREMVLELFPVDPGTAAEPTKTPDPAPDAAVKDPPPPAASDNRRDLPMLPIILGGAGVAMLGTGIVFGVMANSSMAEYETTLPSEASNYDRGVEAANRADDAFDRAEDQGTIAKVLFGVGAGVLIGAGVLLFWQLKERPSEPQVALTPRLGVGDVGLTLTAGWNGGL